MNDREKYFLNIKPNHYLVSDGNENYYVYDVGKYQDVSVNIKNEVPEDQDQEIEVYPVKKDRTVEYSLPPKLIKRNKLQGELGVPYSWFKS